MLERGRKNLGGLWFVLVNMYICEVKGDEIFRGLMIVVLVIIFSGEICWGFCR